MTNEIKVQASLKNNYCIINGERHFPINLESFNNHANFFVQNPNIIQQYPNGYQIEDHKNEIDLFNESIDLLIQYCQNKVISINHKNIIFLNDLVIKFIVPELIKITDDYLSQNKNDFLLQYLMKIQNDPNIKTDIYEDIISKNLNNYVKDDDLLNLNLPILHRIVTKYPLNALNEAHSEIIEFLFKCLDKFGKPASPLFAKIVFLNENSSFLHRLISEESKYSKIFDFHVINTEYHKTIYELQNELIRKDEQIKMKQQEQEKILENFEKERLESQKEMSKMTEIFTKEMTQMKDEMIKMKESFENEMKQMKIKSQTELESQSEIFDQKIGEVKQQISTEINHKNEQISQLEQRIQKNEHFTGLISKLGNSVQISSGGVQDPIRNVENLRTYDKKDFYNYYNVKTKHYDEHLCKNKEDGILLFEFENKKVDILSYFIRTNSCGENWYHPKTWSIEGSNDKTNWNLIDHRSEDSNLRGAYKEHLFICQDGEYGNPRNRYKYIRYRQEDSWHNNKYNLYLTYFEFYGKDYDDN